MAFIKYSEDTRKKLKKLNDTGVYKHHECFAYGSKRFSAIFGADSGKAMTRASSIFYDALIEPYIDCLCVPIHLEKGEQKKWADRVGVQRSTMSTQLNAIRAWSRRGHSKQEKKTPNPTLKTWLAILFGTYGEPPAAKNVIVDAHRETFFYVTERIGKPTELSQAEVLVLAEVTKLGCSVIQEFSDSTFVPSAAMFNRINLAINEMLGSTEKLSKQDIARTVNQKLELWLLTIAGVANDNWLD